MTTETNNEVYNLKDILKQPDRDHFMENINKEVDSLFKEEIWKLGSKQEMIDCHTREIEKGKDIKREKIMMIWSFNVKRHPDGTLNKYKARLCCHWGQY